MALEPYIDAHSHIWTPDVAHYPLASGFTVADMQPPSFTAEELLAICRPEGVGRVNLIQMSYYEFDNSYMLDMIKLYPDRFVGTAIVDPLAAHPDEAMRGLLPKGVRAFRIAPNYSKQPPAKWLEPRGYEAMFAAAAETGQVLSCLIGPDSFAEVDRMCTRFPKTPVIIDHLGRIGVDGKIAPADVQALCALAKHPKLSIKVGAYYALGKKTPPYTDLGPLIRQVLQAYGADRCMWESDCPFQVVTDKYGQSLDLIRKHLDFLTPEDKEWLLHRTADRLLFAKK
ncbi:amidohydrolase family protein [Singulisphaera sp. PoT]|uniref:amidohydrolase family protein n=1 Tax=Singulisphaera sp. PoT TaxID=3411797 RepID=UPI003BF60944